MGDKWQLCTIKLGIKLNQAKCVDVTNLKSSFSIRLKKAGRKYVKVIDSFFYLHIALFIEELPIFLWKLRILMKIAVTAQHSLT